MKVSTELKQMVEDKVIECIHKARLLFDVELRKPIIKYDLTSTTAGMAYIDDNIIRLNPFFLNLHALEFINRTVPHEMAHLIDAQLNPENFDSSYNVRSGRWNKRSLHGPTWKQIMRALGCTPTTYHAYDKEVVPTKQSKYIWKCSCSRQVEIHLGVRRHHKMARGYTKYFHRDHPDCKYSFVGKTETRKDLARKIITENPTLSKDEYIQSFTQLGLSKAAASAYYYDLIKSR